MEVTVKVNGKDYTEDIEPALLLVHFLRDTLGLTGTHWGCDTSNCGACVVQLDGRPVKSCTTLAASCEGHEIRTIESMEVDGQLDPVQQGFHEEHGLQCGFCTPGHDHDHPGPARREPRSLRGGDPHRDLGRDLPLHRLFEHRQGRPLGGRARRRRSEEMTMATTAAKETPLGYGNMKRKEDARFIRGQGTYLDDIVLPGMLHGAILRSPYAHAKILSIDTSKALEHPKVLRVITAKDLETLGLAWMPTISYDSQAVLAGDKVRFQGQEVAFVVAEDRYSARDALPLIDVEYEPLPAIVNARKALDDDAPLIRDDKPDQKDNLASALWEAGDAEECDRVFAEADVVVERDMIYPRCHPAPLETCGMIADMNPETGQLDIYNGNQAPNLHRTVYAQVAGLPEQMIRIMTNDIGGGFGNKVPVYPGLRLRDRRLDRLGQAGQVGRGPLREPDVDGLRARLRDERPHLRQGRQDHRRPGRRDRRPRRLRQHRAALEVPGGFFHVFAGLIRPRGRALLGQGRVHEQGARRRGLPLLVPGHRGDLPDRAAGRRAGAGDGGGPDRAADEELHQARAVPLREQDGLDLRLGRVREDDARGDEDRRLRRAAQGAGREAREAAS